MRHVHVVFVSLMIQGDRRVRLAAAFALRRVRIGTAPRSAKHQVFQKMETVLVCARGGRESPRDQHTNRHHVPGPGAGDRHHPQARSEATGWRRRCRLSSGPGSSVQLPGSLCFPARRKGWMPRAATTTASPDQRAGWGRGECAKSERKKGREIVRCVTLQAPGSRHTDATRSYREPRGTARHDMNAAGGGMGKGWAVVRIPWRGGCSSSRKALKHSYLGLRLSASWLDFVHTRNLFD